MSPPRDHRGRIGDDEIDALFDRELSAQGRSDLFARAAKDPDAADRIGEMAEVVSAFRVEVEAPDLTRAVLARTARRRSFLPARGRRLVWASRVGMAACLGLVVAGVGMIERTHPGVLDLTPEVEPVTAFADAFEADAVSGIRSIAHMADAFCVDNIIPDEQPGAATIADTGWRGDGGHHAAGFAMTELDRSLWSTPEHASSVLGSGSASMRWVDAKAHPLVLPRTRPPLLLWSAETESSVAPILKVE